MFQISQITYFITWSTISVTQAAVAKIELCRASPTPRTMEINSQLTLIDGHTELKFHFKCNY